MAEKPISVVIANRTYPVTVEDGTESEVLAAARVITDMLREFENSYSVRDKQDLLAMCALHLAVKSLNPSSLTENKLREHLDKLKDLDRQLTAELG